MAGIREQRRAQVNADILTAARRQLAASGAASISLREVARDLGMVSSGIYRYVESRDELLTRLIVDSYESLAAAAESAAADADADGDLERWLAAAHAVRDWAHDHPHDYLLIFGTPVPGYAAPETTVTSGTRVVACLIGIVGDAAVGGRLAPLVDAPLPAGQLAADLAGAVSQVPGVTEAPELADPALASAFIAAWTQMFGFVGFELTNQMRGLTADGRGLYELVVGQLAHQLGLRRKV